MYFHIGILYDLIMTYYPSAQSMCKMTFRNNRNSVNKYVFNTLWLLGRMKKITGFIQLVWIEDSDICGISGSNKASFTQFKNRGGSSPNLCVNFL